MRCCRCVVCVTKVGMFDDSSAAVRPARPLEAGGVAVPITIITFLHLSLSQLFVFLTQNIIRSASHLGNSDERCRSVAGSEFLMIFSLLYLGCVTISCVRLLRRETDSPSLLAVAASQLGSDQFFIRNDMKFLDSF